MERKFKRQNRVEYFILLDVRDLFHSPNVKCFMFVCANCEYAFNDGKAMCICTFLAKYFI